jgi:hypothetical protein
VRGAAVDVSATEITASSHGGHEDHGEAATEDTEITETMLLFDLELSGLSVAEFSVLSVA